MSITDAYTGSGGGLNEAHKGLESGRVGRDGIGPARTFHCNIGSVKVGESAQASLDYIRRTGEHKGDAADVESEAGNPQAVLDDAGLIEASARIRRGANAERQLVTEVYELPADSTPEDRKKVAEAVVADWRGRGHEAVAVVHMHGDRTPQPHLHVALASRPVDDAGNVDRSRRLLTGRDQIRDERAHVAEIVNRICEPEVRFHPGRLIDTGIERPARKRIPPAAFHTARKQIRAAPEKAAAIEAEMYAESAKERRKLHGEREDRRVEIGALKKVGKWRPPSERARLEKRAEEGRAASDVWYRYYKKSVAREADRTAERDEQRLRADRAEMIGGATRVAGEHTHAELQAVAATLKAEKQKAETRADTAGRRARELEELNKTQTKYVTNWHANRKVVLPDLATVEGQSAAWANMWAWDARALKKARDEAGAAVTAATTAEKERDEQRERAEKAEDRVPALEQRAGDAEVLVRELEARQVQPLPLNEKQREMLVGVCARKRIDGDPVHDARVQLLAFAAHHEERDKAREERKRREAEAKLELEAEKQEQNRDGRGTGEAGGAGRQPDQGADRPGTEARRGGGAEDHGAGRAERPRAGGDRPEGGPHAVDGNAGGDRGAASPAAREPGGVESRVVAAPDREDAEGLAREHRLVAESGGVETPADRSSDGDGAMVGDNGGGEWAWLLDVGDAGDGPGPRRPVVAEPPPDVVVSGAGKGGEAAPEPPPPARPWKDLSDDELVNHWDGASRRRRRAATDEQKADARQKIDELHAEAKHRNTTLKALDARKQQREGRGRGMEM